MPRTATLALGLAFIACATLFGAGTLHRVGPDRDRHPAAERSVAAMARGVSVDADASADADGSARACEHKRLDAGLRDAFDSASPENAAALKMHGRKPLDGRLPLNRRHPQVAKVIEVKSRHLDLMNHPQVVGMAVGLNADQELAIVVYTTVAGVELPESLEGVPVDARASGAFLAGRKRADQDGQLRPRTGETSYAQRWDRPVPIGVSTGHPSITAGTIGCRVKNAGGSVFALSNNHVYAASNTASLGSVVLQPGTYDGGASPADNLGTLSAFKTIIFGGPPHSPQNTIDAAIAATTASDLGTGTPSIGGYGTPSTTVADPAINAAVTKVGRTTGHTQGTIDAIDATVSITYGTGKAHFHTQFVVVPGTFSAGGDSGSLIVSNDGNKNPVGLLFAGSTSHTIANEIQLVLNHFSVSVDNTASTGNATPVVTISSPAGGSNHPNGATSPITFTGTANDTEDGNISAGLVWTSSLQGTIGTGGSFSTTLNEGAHTITASSTDSASATGTASISITVGVVTVPTTVGATSITYSMSGGKTGDRNLLITVTVKDDLGNLVTGASVSIAIDNTTTGAGATGTATTVGGTVTFTWRSAPSGAYTTTVTGITASGLTWDGATPANGFTKP